MRTTPNLEDIKEAHTRIKPLVHRTPVLTCRAIDDMLGATLFFKCENLQKVGAFKIRGACNAVYSLDDPETENGVATHSSGNHGAALALAAQWRGIRAYVVMPENSSAVKLKAVAGYGAEIILCKPNQRARDEKLESVLRSTGAALVHPYNDHRVICGQGTAALELCEDIPGLDVVMTPVGGGGLLSGTALSVKGLSPSTQVVAGEPERADDAHRSLKAGRIIPVKSPDTIADGLRTSLGDLTFPIIAKHVRDIITVSEEGIVTAMRLIWERMKIIVEPSASVPLGAVMARPDDFRGKRVGIILSGGNVDLDALPWMGREVGTGD
jgi:threonine dehydratase